MKMAKTYTYVGTGRHTGLPQGDIDQDAFERLSTHRQHLVLHSGDWQGENTIEVPDFAAMKRADLDTAAAEYSIDPAAYERADDLRAALVTAYEKGVR